MTRIGTPASRVDGRAKVTGAAKYAAEFEAENLAYGAVVSSRVAKGRVVGIDLRDALGVEGVIDVLTHENRPRMARSKKAYEDDIAPGGAPFRPLYDDKILYNAQPVALVLAEDWETARYAASLVRVDYEQEAHVTELESQRDEAFDAKNSPKPRGNAEKAFAAADVQHEAEYWLPIEHHNPMEMHAATVIYEGKGKLTIYDKTQGVQNSQAYVASVFRLKQDDVRVISQFVGGAFGSGLRPQYHLPLAVLGALALKRSVRLVLTRQQMFTFGYRPGTIQRVALGAKSGGTLDAIMHDALAMTSQYEDFTEHVTNWSGALYKCANARYGHKLARLDLATPIDMRAPGGATGVYALECAMDELAVALKLDPLELRLRCYSDRDQNEGIPFSSKKLRECYRQGADAFGWDKRNGAPRSMRDGSELVGWGMATGIWEAMQQKASARIVLTANGHAEVACAFTDIGPGTYTMMAQVAADRLGLPLENVTVKLGDSTLPQAPVEGGSWTAASAGNAIALACEGVRTQLVRFARKVANSPLADAKPDDAALVDGRIVSKQDSSCSVSIPDAMRAANKERIEQEATAESNDDGKHARYTHSAIFAEVKIDEELRIVRVTRIVNAVAAGRIINPKTARSQILGGVVFGLGMALHEETQVDHRLGRIVNHNLAEYHVPANADVHDIEVIFVDEPDEIINPLGVKGVGEIGVVGTAAAIANAIWHATGIRVRDLPVTVDKILG
ncbi:MAG: xanthine dehydrogenase family protein molybdopterin-binding subunit [Alphaproteobacteria bacterium]|nr:MAG: xanthine dehydrogenase family protein molybdopterin-binding subunit [Alphaproteobacteria bacterium]